MVQLCHSPATQLDTQTHAYIYSENSCPDSAPWVGQGKQGSGRIIMGKLISTKPIVAIVAALALSACSGGIGGGASSSAGDLPASHPESSAQKGSSIWDIFKPSDVGTNVKVNKYIWNASLDVLSFLPVESVDPFSGVITTGYGRPPGGGRAYRATILVSDPALEARSLNVALQSRSGPVSVATSRAVEDAILARARQLRAVDSRF